MKKTRKSEKPVRSVAVGGLAYAWSQIWRTVVAGLLVWVPLIITVWLTYFVVNKFVLSAERNLRQAVSRVTDLAPESGLLAPFGEIAYPPGLATFLVFSLFFATGLLTRHLVGQRIIAVGERLVAVIPLVNRIYRAVQQIRDVFISRRGAVFQDVCLVDYPRAGMKAVAFVTSREQGIVQEVTGRELQAVFVPTTPNPTSGYLVYLPPEEITVVDLTVEDAMKLIVSAGAYLPSLRDHQEADEPRLEPAERAHVPRDERQAPKAS
jgi:uncharacterized membrane protein